MRRTPSIQQQHALAFAKKIPRSPGAERAGTHDDVVQEEAPVAERGSPACAPATLRTRRRSQQKCARAARDAFQNRAPRDPKSPFEHQLQILESCGGT